MLPHMPNRGLVTRWFRLKSPLILRFPICIFSSSGFELRLLFWLYLVGVVPRVFREVVFRSLTKHSMTMTSTIRTLSVCLNCLPLYVVHALYTMVLDNPISMVSIEMNPAFQDVSLVCHYICLFHHYAHMRINLSIVVALSPESVQ